jgi:hypothetical protein
MDEEGKLEPPAVPQEQTVTADQAAFIEKKTKQLFDYTMECLDRGRAEGNNVLQWLFGVITGGLAAIGALWVKGYTPLAFGFATSVCAAACIAMKLVRDLRSRETQPPGNLAEHLNTLLGGPMARMRWREAMGMDARIQTNLTTVASICTAVDQARRRFARIPLWFAVGTVFFYAAKLLFLVLARRYLIWADLAVVMAAV